MIENRLVTSAIPLQMRNLVVAEGAVTFTVPLEFSCRLTVLGDGASLPWTLLGVEMLVEDRETGQGKALLHGLQTGYLVGLAQSRLQDTASPLEDLYSLLHSLAQLLQLEVLHTQVARLCQDRLRDSIRVEEYILGRALTVSYWRELATSGQSDATHQDSWRLSVQVDPHDPRRPLMVVHSPTLSLAEAQLAETSIRTERLSVESLLVHTIYVRTRARLTGLKLAVQEKLRLGEVEAGLHGSPAVLSIPLLHPLLRSEQLLVSVDTHSGLFLAHVPQYPTNPFSPQIQSCLNSDQAQLAGLVTQLRYWITARRVEKTLQQLPASPYEQLPLMYDLKTHPLSKLASRHKMFIKLHKQPRAVLVVAFNEKPGSECEIQFSYYFLLTKECSIEDDPLDETIVKDIPKVYMKALGLVEFDPFLVTHGSTTKVDVQELDEKIIGKRKPGGKVEAPIKRTRFPAYFIAELAHVVSFADERIPFTYLEQELSKQGVSHTGTVVETNGVGLAIRIVKFPPVAGLSAREDRLMSSRLLSVTIRLSRSPVSVWTVEWRLAGSPLSGSPAPSSTPLHQQLKLEPIADCGSTVAAVVGEWASLAQLHSLARELGRTGSNLVSVQSYTYRSLVLEYGPANCYTCTVTWAALSARFALSFGGSAGAVNPHSVMRAQLELELEQSRSLALLGRLLQETAQPVRSLLRLPATPHKWMSTSSQQRNTAIQTFSLLPQSPTHVKVLFYNVHCVDIHIRGDGLVQIRDGSFSMFDQTKVSKTNWL